MAAVIVASQHHTAVQIFDVNAPEGVEPATAEIQGNRAPGSVEGYGLTYNVDDALFNGWAAAFPEISNGMKITDEAEIDTWQDAANHYGYELGLQEAEAASGEEDPRFTAIQEATDAVNEIRSKLAEDQRLMLVAEAKLVRVSAPAPTPTPGRPPAQPPEHSPTDHPEQPPGQPGRNPEHPDPRPRPPEETPDQAPRRTPPRPGQPPGQPGQTPSSPQQRPAQPGQSGQVPPPPAQPGQPPFPGQPISQQRQENSQP
jgi:hypothetical protein